MQQQGVRYRKYKGIFSINVLHLFRNYGIYGYIIKNNLSANLFFHLAIPVYLLSAYNLFPVRR